MNIDALINEKIQRLQDLNKQMTEIARKIGVLQEEGKALHGSALQLKGAIEGLAELQAKEKAEKDAAVAALILPDKSLVAADGKTQITAQPEAAPVESKSQSPEALAHDAEAKKAETVPVIQGGLPTSEIQPLTLEVK